MSIRTLSKSIMRNETGASLLELALVTPLLVLLMLAAVDFGRAFYMGMEIAGAAQAGAAYGSQNPTDATGIETAAKDDAPDVTGLTVATPSYGCECSDGTGYSANCGTTPSCPANVVYSVKVTVSTNYSPWFPWPGVPTSIPIHDSAIMRSSGS